MGRFSEVKPQHMLNAGELARLKEVVSPARLRCTALLGVDDRIRLYLRGGDPHGRHDQHVRMFQGGQHLLAQQGPKLQRFIVGQGRSQAPGEVGYPVVVLDLLQPFPYQLPIVGGGLNP